MRVAKGAHQLTLSHELVRRFLDAFARHLPRVLEKVVDLLGGAHGSGNGHLLHAAVRARPDSPARWRERRRGGTDGGRDGRGGKTAPRTRQPLCCSFAREGLVNPNISGYLGARVVRILGVALRTFLYLHTRISVYIRKTLIIPCACAIDTIYGQ